MIEVGSRYGDAARLMAKHMPEDGLVIAIDSCNPWGDTQHNSDQENARMFRELYEIQHQQFLSNVYHENLQHKVTLLRMRSNEAAKALKIKVDMIYLDAAHDFESVYDDICLWRPKLNKFGLLCGDDWSWGDSLPVQKAVKKFAKENKLRIETDGRFWCYSEDTEPV